MKHIASLSYGKDSLAMLEAIHRLGYPLDEIVHVEIWATDTISANLPPVVEFKRHADKIIKERYGLDVRHVCATNDDGGKRTFEQCFYGVPSRRKKKEFEGKILGFPMLYGRWCLKALKLSAMPKHGADEIQYVGIAADETARINNKNNAGCVLPLVDIGWTEADAMQWCRENDIVSPAYETSFRDGCWFCPCQDINSLRALRRDWPDLWALMLKWDNDSPITFRAEGLTLHDYDRRFALEDAGLLNPEKAFRWKSLDILEKQQRLWEDGDQQCK